MYGNIPDSLLFKIIDIYINNERNYYVYRNIGNSTGERAGW